MNWTSWADFASMGGHGPYVWAALGVCVLAVLAESVLLGARLRRRLSAPPDGESA